MSEQRLLVIGASARAACFSAQRAGYSPYWIDQFGDFDLAEKFPGQAVAANTYPRGLLDCIDDLPPMPFIYTGAMENHLSVLEAIQAKRELLGNPAASCRALRDPQQLAACFRAAAISHPRIACPGQSIAGCEHKWLRKPLRGAGGAGIAFCQSAETYAAGEYYLQEFISGESQAGVYIADGSSASLIGVSRQLLGEEFLHAAAFAYCGSIGPLPLSREDREQWQHIGTSLTRRFGLRGLFGVDAICHDSGIYPVELNPRYSASVEVLELAMKLPLLRLHCEACRGRPPNLPAAAYRGAMMAKAYLFADTDRRSPPRSADIYQPQTGVALMADIPSAQTVIPQGQPMMSILAEVENPRQGVQLLRQRAELLYPRFQVISADSQKQEEGR